MFGKKESITTRTQMRFMTTESARIWGVFRMVDSTVSKYQSNSLEPLEPESTLSRLIFWHEIQNMTVNTIIPPDLRKCHVDNETIIHQHHPNETTHQPQKGTSANGNKKHYHWVSCQRKMLLRPTFLITAMIHQTCIHAHTDKHYKSYNI